MESVHDIKARAKANGITMTALCAQAGIHQSQASRWLKGVSRPLWESVAGLEEALEALLFAKQVPAPGQEQNAAARIETTASA